MVPLRMRDETNVLVGVVGSSGCESMQHRFPDVGEVVIDEQNVGQLAARQLPAQVGRCDKPSDPATYHNDTVHIACPSTSLLPRMGEVKTGARLTHLQPLQRSAADNRNLGRRVRNVGRIFPSGREAPSRCASQQNVLVERSFRVENGA